MRESFVSGEAVSHSRIRSCFNQLRSITRVRRVPLLVLGATVLGGMLRLYDLGGKSFWIDELISLCHAEAIQDIASFLSAACGNVHPPLYFLILKGWSAFGGGEVYLRFLSVFFGVAVIPAVYFLGREVLAEGPAVGAAFLAAVSPFYLLYDREVRMYSLLTFLTVSSVYFFLRALRTGRNVHWALYTILTTLNVYVHYHACLVVAFEWVFYFLGYAKYRQFWLKAVISQLVVAACFVFWLPGFWYQIQNPTLFTLDAPDKFPVAIGAWIVKPFYIFYAFSLGQTILPWNVVAIVGAIAVSIAAFLGVKSVRENRDALQFAALFLAVPLTIGMLVSLSMPRYYVFLAPVYYLILAQGVLSLPRPLMKGAACLLLLIPVVVSASNYFQNREFHVLAPVDPWREVGTYIRERAKPEDCVIAIGSFRPLGYYLDSYKGFSQPIYSSDFEGSRQCMESGSGRRIWLVGADPAVRSLTERAKSWLEAEFTPLAEKRFFRDSDYQMKAKLFKKDFLEYRISVYLYGTA